MENLKTSKALKIISYILIPILVAIIGLSVLHLAFLNEYGNSEETKYIETEMFASDYLYFIIDQVSICYNEKQDNSDYFMIVEDNNGNKYNYSNHNYGYSRYNEIGSYIDYIIIDKETNEELVEEVVIKGYEGDEYKTEEKEIENYKLVERPENHEGIMKVEIVEDVVNNKTYVTYYYQKKTFNLSVDKTILSIIQNGQEKGIYGDLAKAEIYRKNVDSDGLQVIYSIKVTNSGELAGKATILENIPAGMIMNPSYNPNWNISGSTATIETEEIQPGETVEYRVALDWANGGNNVGSKENTAEIIETSNEAGFEETDTSDNKDNAILVIAVSTGAPTYVAIAGGMLIILDAITVSIIHRKKKQK